ncbi:MAG: hypothetical protein IAF94_12785 [Pirellulaceae bacterium]|nr:hypothetical protein [Pirellulaceae bacterium]
MQIPVVVEPIGDNLFRAQGPDPFGFAAEGATSQEALQNLRKQIAASTTSGKQVVMMEVPGNAIGPGTDIVGIFKDNPLFDEWQKIVEQKREEAVEDAPW